MIAAHRRLTPQRRQLIRSFEREGNVIRMTYRFDVRDHRRFDASDFKDDQHDPIGTRAQAWLNGLVVDAESQARLERQAVARVRGYTLAVYDLNTKPPPGWSNPRLDHSEALRRCDVIAEHLIEGLPKGAHAACRAGYGEQRAKIDETERKRVDSLPQPTYRADARRTDDVRTDSRQYRSDDEYLRAKTDALFRAGRDGAAPKDGE